MVLVSLRSSLVWAAAALVLLAPGPVRAEENFDAKLVARSFFRGLLAGEAKALLPLCAPRVNFDGQVAEGPAAVKARLERLVARAGRLKLKLRALEVIPAAEAIKRYGPPPKRLAGWVKKADMVALAAFQRRGAVAVLRKLAGVYRLVLLSD